MRYVHPTTSSKVANARPATPNCVSDPVLAYARAICGHPDREEQDRLDPAEIIGRVIRMARKKGWALNKLPLELRVTFQGLCRQRDPACLVVQEWLKGNRAFLPQDVLELAADEETGR